LNTNPTSTERLRALLVDDEPSFRKVLRASLGTSGFAAEEATCGEDAIEILTKRSFDLVLLDLNMPGMDGITACRQIRELRPKIGIVMITVRDGENDMVKAFDYGADDYLTKPIRFRELVARLRAVCRRLQVSDAEEPDRLRVGELELDMTRRILYRNGEFVHLTPTEFHLLELLMRNEGSPVPHAKLLRSIWGPEYGGESEYLRSFVKTLRKKIELDPSCPKYLLTEPWFGYRMCNPADAASSRVE
jgi:two-component system, OmpR family, KDP operon response regulator KdpE